MTIRTETCPACAAPISVPGDAVRFTCPYCATPLAIERDDAGDVAVIAQITQAVEATGAETQSLIREGTAVTQAELQRLHTAQALSHARLRLTHLQSEIRALERLPVNRTTRAQLRDLRAQESQLLQQVRDLQTELEPEGADAAADRPQPAQPIRAAEPSYWLWLLFGWGGRLERPAYWAGWVIAAGLIALAAALGDDSATQAETASGGAIPALLMLVGLWMLLALQTKRLRDRGKPAWWLLLWLLPGIGPLWLIVELGFLPGRE